MTKLTPLIHARIEAGYMTQTDFAKAAGLSHWTINMIENCKRTGPFKEGTINKMSKALNVPPNVIESWLKT